MKFNIGDRIVEARINGVYKSNRDWKVEPIMWGGSASRVKAIEHVWLSVNPILKSRDDIAYFGINKFDSSIYDDISTENASILLTEFALPIDSLMGDANVVIHRHERPIEGESSPSDSECCNDNSDSEEPPCDNSKTTHVWTVSVPENGSKLDRFALFNRWEKTFDHHSRPKADDGTRKLSRTEKRRAAEAQRKLDQNLASPLPMGVRVEKLISSVHVRKTLCEAEIEAGEFGQYEMVSIPAGCRDPQRPKVMTLCIDFYIDKFGVFRTTHRSAGAMYLTFHNMNFKGRDQVRNHFVVGFTPNGASTQHSAAPIIRELKALAKDGFSMNIDGEETTVFVKLLTVSADMAEAAGLSGCRGANAIVPCRFCTLPKKAFTAASLSDPRWLQQQRLRQVCNLNTRASTNHSKVHTMKRIREKAAAENATTSGVDKALMPHGLHINPGVLELEGPSFNQFEQVALDIAHSEQKGIGKT